MNTPIKQAQQIFEQVQQAWSNAFTDSPWHTEVIHPKPNYINRIMTLEQHPVFEKAGIACSTLAGSHLPEAASKRHPECVNQPFEVTGISLVFHPQNPFAPSVHANLRFFSSGTTWWFGGGMDLTPYYPTIEHCKHWHHTIQKACERLEPTCYHTFKQACDDYFFLKHRGEMRGIGGIFFDDLNNHPQDQLLNWMTDLGQTFIDAYGPIIDVTKDQTFTPHHRVFQQHRRTRYAEFNLLYDRGTLFGLQFGGRIESILMSMPPTTGWRYQLSPDISADEAHLATFLQPQCWV